MAQINISVLVDADNLKANLVSGHLQPGTKGSPTSIGGNADSDNYIYMIAKNGVVQNNQAKSELTITAGSGDQITWNMTTFSQNAPYSTFIYDSKFNLQSGTAPIGIDNVSYVNIKVGTRVPTGTAPQTDPLGQYVNTIYRTTANVTNINQTIQYTMSFQMIDDASGAVLGYFVWDPFIIIPF